MKSIFKLALLLALCYTVSATEKNITKLENDTLFSGYIHVDKYDALFFLMMESRRDPSTDPIIIWLQGDCASGIGMFTENGPYNFKFDKMSKPAFNLTHNKYSWNNNANVLYLDFPLGVGFS